MSFELTEAKYLLDDEREKLLHTLEKFKQKDPRNCTLIWLALHTGARASEILNITREDFNPKTAVVFIRGLKGSNNRSIPLPGWLAVRMFKISVGPGERLFPISYSRFKQVWYDYRPVKKKLHSLRHTCAVNLYMKTKDLKLTQKVLGHKSIMHTMIYADYQYSMDEMRRAMT